MLIRIKYRVDQRIKVAEIKTGTTGFLVKLEDLALIAGINDFTESHVGEALITIETYKLLKEERLTYAEPTSFRFRRAKTESKDV
jgi:hypothetical protein